jgi:hypothetical protein
MLGLAHIGVLRAFVEKGVRIDHLTAMSLGSVIATLFANGVDSSAIEQMFFNRKARRFMREAWLGHGKCHQYTYGKVQDLLPEARNFVEKNHLKPRAMLRLLCFDVVEARTVAYEGVNYDLAAALTASCSVAGLMRPIRKGNAVLVDCSLYGCKVETPSTGATIISDVKLEGAIPEDGLSPVDRWLDRRSRLIGAESPCESVAGEDVLVIKTTVPNEALVAYGCSEEAIERIINAGYESALKFLDKHGIRRVAQLVTARHASLLRGHLPVSVAANVEVETAAKVEAEPAPAVDSQDTQSS